MGRISETLGCGQALVGESTPAYAYDENFRTIPSHGGLLMLGVSSAGSTVKSIHRTPLSYFGEDCCISLRDCTLFIVVMTEESNARLT